MNGRFGVRLTLLLTAVALVLPGTALAQTGAIAGEVTDETGGVLPGVTINGVGARLLSRTPVGDRRIGGGPHSSDQERALLRWSLLGLFSS